MTQTGPYNLENVRPQAGWRNGYPHTHSIQNMRRHPLHPHRFPMEGGSPLFENEAWSSPYDTTECQYCSAWKSGRSPEMGKRSKAVGSGTD